MMYIEGLQVFGDLRYFKFRNIPSLALINEEGEKFTLRINF